MLIRRIGVIGRAYRQIERYTEILGVLFRFGFGDLVISLKVERYLDVGRQLIFRKPKEPIEHLSRAERARMVLEELGPAFIKLGQALSTRPDLLPREFIDELVKLQDKVPPFPYDEALKIIEESLERPVSEIFAHIDPEPMAAASLGQVHRARLVTGEEVVIKVQRPGLRRVVEVDLEIMLHMSGLMERHVEGWDVHKPSDVVEEFGRTLERELDYGLEASNMDRFTVQHRDTPWVYIPRVFRRATTDRVLTMEFVDGVKASDFDELRKRGYDLAEIANRGGDLVLEQTLVYGFFHADPHPGNLLILPGHVICLLDMGMTGRMDRHTRDNLVDLLTAAVRQDPAKMVGALMKLTEWEEEPDRRGMLRAASAFMDKFLGRPLKEIQLSAVLETMFDVAVDYRLRVPPDLLMLIRALSVIEGLARQMNPDFDVMGRAEPFVRRVTLSRLDPVHLATGLYDYSQDMGELLRILPADLRTILTLTRKGKLRLEIEARGMEQMMTNQARASNRISFAVVLGALIVGSSIIMLAGLPPLWHNVPILGLAGYLVSGAMGFWLLVNILRRGMM